jgi:hypothetical protein
MATAFWQTASGLLLILSSTTQIARDVLFLPAPAAVAYRDSRADAHNGKHFL